LTALRSSYEALLREDGAGSSVIQVLACDQRVLDHATRSWKAITAK
jgi:hypothetical protein